MRPEMEYLDESGRHFSDDHRYPVVAVTPVEKPHNEKPAAKVSPGYLREAIDLIETFDWGTVYVWDVDGPGENARSLAFTPEKDSKMAVFLTGRGGL